MSVLRRLKAVSDHTEAVLTSPRDRLAEAIERSREAAEAADKVRAAVRLAEKMVLDAEGRHVRAAADLETARQARAASIAAAAGAGRSVEPDAGLRTARSAEIEAADEIEAARQALGAVRAPLAGFEAAEARARDAVTEAAGVVLSAQIPSLQAEAMEAFNRLTAQVRVLSFLARADSTAVFDTERRNVVRGAETLISNVFSTHFNLHGRHVAEQSEDVTAPWRDALETLQADASAPLPFESATALHNDAA